MSNYYQYLEHNTIKPVSDTLNMYGIRHTFLPDTIIVRDVIPSNILRVILTHVDFEVKVVNNNMHLINFKPLK